MSAIIEAEALLPAVRRGLVSLDLQIQGQVAARETLANALAGSARDVEAGGFAETSISGSDPNSPIYPRVPGEQPQCLVDPAQYGFSAMKTGVICDPIEQDVEIAISGECFDNWRPRHDSRGSTGPMATSTVPDDGLNFASGSNTAGKLRPGLANGGVQSIEIARDEIANIDLTGVVRIYGNPG